MRVPQPVDMTDSPSPQPKQRKKVLLPTNPLNESSSPVPKPRQKFSRIASPSSPVVASPKTTRGALLNCRLFEHQAKEDGKSDESEINSEDDGDESDESFVSAGLDHSNASRHEYLAGLSSQTELPPPICNTRFAEEGREPLADVIERRLREEGKQRKLNRLRLAAEAAANAAGDILPVPSSSKPLRLLAEDAAKAAADILPVPSSPKRKQNNLLDWLRPVCTPFYGLNTFISLKISDTSCHPLSPKPKLSRMKLKKISTTFEPRFAPAAGPVTLSPAVSSPIGPLSQRAAAAGSATLSPAVASTVEPQSPVAPAAGPVTLSPAVSSPIGPLSPIAATAGSATLSPAVASTVEPQSTVAATAGPVLLTPAVASPNSPPPLRSLRVLDNTATFRTHMALKPGSCLLNMAIQCDILPPHCTTTPRFSASRLQTIENKVSTSTQTSPRSFQQPVAAQTPPRLHVSTLTLEDLRSELDRYNRDLLIAFGF
jgi:hypothetical protein